ncbi:MAG: branched-chain amino acid transport system II carrier protein [Chlamydiota bacterium]
MIHSLSSKSYRLAIGFALFAMFFGSGNLIFPLSIGFYGEEHWVWGSVGFMITGVLLPFLGIITMVSYEGDYTKFFRVLGEKGGFIFAFALLTAWIPFGSGPRCVVLSFANVENYLFDLPLWLYSLVYCVIVCIISYRKSAALDILGYVLTPVLLLSLAAVIYLGIEASPGYSSGDMTASGAFWFALTEGYQTQDLIASFFFASAIIDIISTNARKGDCPVKIAFGSSIVGILLLGTVYTGLIALSASSGHLLNGLPKESLLATVVDTYLPAKFAFTGSLAVALACLTTSIALTLVYADFLEKNFFDGKLSRGASILVTSVVVYLFSLTGFDVIAAVISPCMQVFYPCLIGLIVWNMVIKKFLLRGTSRIRQVAGKAD